MIWIKNTHGKKDATLSFLVLVLAVIVVTGLFGGSTLPFGFVIAKADAGWIAAVWAPLLAAYVARRNEIGAKERLPEKP